MVKFVDLRLKHPVISILVQNSVNIIGVVLFEFSCYIRTKLTGNLKLSKSWESLVILKCTFVCLIDDRLHGCRMNCIHVKRGRSEELFSIIHSKVFRTI